MAEYCAQQPKSRQRHQTSNNELKNATAGHHRPARSGSYSLSRSFAWISLVGSEERDKTEHAADYEDENNDDSHRIKVVKR